MRVLELLRVVSLSPDRIGQTPELIDTSKAKPFVGDFFALGEATAALQNLENEHPERWSLPQPNRLSEPRRLCARILFEGHPDELFRVPMTERQRVIT
jgi:hypothetical protein